MKIKTILIILIVLYPLTCYPLSRKEKEWVKEFSQAVTGMGYDPMSIATQLKSMHDAMDANDYRLAVMQGNIIYATFKQMGQAVQDTRIYGDFLLDHSLSYFKIGMYPQALYYGFEAEKLWEKHIKTDEDYYVKASQNLAVFYNSLNDYTQAEIWIERTIERTKGENKYLGNYLEMLNTLACLENKRGNTKKAVSIIDEVLELNKKHGVGNTLLWKNNRLDFLYKLKRYDEAMIGYKDLLDEYKQNGNYTKECEVLGSMAKIYFNKGQTVEAMQLNETIIHLYKSNANTLNEKYARCLRDMAGYYYAKGDMENSINYCKRSINILERISLENSPVLVSTMKDLAVYQFKAGNAIEAENTAIEATKLFDKNIRHSLFSLAGTRENIWNSEGGWYMNSIPTMAAKINDEKINQLAYDAALFSKGLLLNSEISIAQLAQESSPEIKKIYQEWQTAKNELKKPHSNDEILKLDSVAKNNEIILLRELQPQSENIKRLSVSWLDVQSKLKSGEIAIEFICYDNNQYAALILKSDFKSPKLVLLPNISNSIIDSENNPFIVPLMDYLQGVETIYFSPAGEIYNLPVESFPIPGEPTKIMSQRFKIYRLSSTRELALRRDGGGAALYGGLNYGTSVAVLKKNQAQFRSADEVYNPYLDSLDVRSGISELTYSRPEVDSIKYEMDRSTRMKWDTKLYVDTAGTEASFKALSGQGKNLIHVSTHGFYDDSRTRRSIQSLNPNAGTDEDRALQRSGLYFAGANQRLLSSEWPEGLDDGILTAQEVAALDLRGTDMVVLSACRTGVGEVKGDGVFGLQRGFKKAGAGSLLMSLWNVSDAATSMLMTEFYREWMGGATKREALERAKAAVRSHKTVTEDFSHPQYWAPFILLDALDALD